MSVSTIAARAADLIDEKGWGQGMRPSRRDRSTLCIQDAISAAVEEMFADRVTGYRSSEEWKGAVNARISLARPVENWVLSKIRPALARADWWALTTWNDQPGRTKEEVVAVLRSIAEEAE